MGHRALAYVCFGTLRKKDKNDTIHVLRLLVSLEYVDKNKMCFFYGNMGICRNFPLSLLCSFHFLSVEQAYLLLRILSWVGRWLSGEVLALYVKEALVESPVLQTKNNVRNIFSLCVSLFVVLSLCTDF